MVRRSAAHRETGQPGFLPGRLRLRWIRHLGRRGIADPGDRIIARKNLTTTALVAAALLVTAVLTVWVVGYTLRPLRRVAATAAEVAAMPLAGDDHRISARVRRRTPIRTTRSASSDRR